MTTTIATPELNSYQQTFVAIAEKLNKFLPAHLTACTGTRYHRVIIRTKDEKAISVGVLDIEYGGKLSVNWHGAGAGRQRSAIYKRDRTTNEANWSGMATKAAQVRQQQIDFVVAMNRQHEKWDAVRAMEERNRPLVQDLWTPYETDPRVEPDLPGDVSLSPNGNHLGMVDITLSRRSFTVHPETARAVLELMKRLDAEHAANEAKEG